jgi:hypothetical protein
MSSGLEFLHRWSRRKRQAQEAAQARESADWGDRGVTGPGVLKDRAQAEGETANGITQLEAHGAGDATASGGPREPSDERCATAQVGAKDAAAALRQLGPEDARRAVNDLHGLESDYRPFLGPEVEESTKRAALKRLFADPHFNRMDGLDVYIDDYSKPAALSAAAAAALKAFRYLASIAEAPASPPDGAAAAGGVSEATAGAADSARDADASPGAADTAHDTDAPPGLAAMALDAPEATAGIVDESDPPHEPEAQHRKAV